MGCSDSSPLSSSRLLRFQWLRFSQSFFSGRSLPLLLLCQNELALKMKSLCSSTPLSNMSEENDIASNNLAYTSTLEPKPPVASQNNDIWEVTNVKSPWEALSVRSASVEQSLVQEYLSFLNTASKEDLKRLKGIGEKRATYILDCRVETPEPFKSLDDLQDIGLSGKLVKNMMKSAGGLFD